MNTSAAETIAEVSDVNGEHLQHVVDLANELGRKPSSNKVIGHLKKQGVPVGRATANKLLEALDRTGIEDHLTGPRLTVVPQDRTESTGPTDAESTQTEPVLGADRTAESTESTAPESGGPEVPSPVDRSTGPTVDSAAQSAVGPVPDYRTDHSESGRESTRTVEPQSSETANSDHQVHFPTVDPDWPIDLHQTTEPGWTEHAPVHPDPSVDTALVHPVESTRTEPDATPVQVPQSAGPDRTETTPDRTAQDRDHLPESTGPATVAAPSAKAQKLLQSAGQAAHIRAYQTHPDVIALRAERIRAWTGRLVWTGLVMGLAFTMANVQRFAAKGADAGTPEWATAWLLDPMVSLVLVGLLLAESVTSRYGIKMGRWVRAAKWFALAATYAMNTWVAWTSLDPASILLHSVPPALVFFAAEAITDAWEKITEAVNVAVQQARRNQVQK